MPELKLLWICNHTGVIETETVDTFQIVRGTGVEDIIKPNMMLIDVVSASDISGETAYYPGVDLIPFRHNRVKWLTNPLSPGDKYLVTVKYIDRHIVDKANDPDNCELCDGRGWTINLFSPNTGNIEYATGLDAAMQLFFKFLLTSKMTDPFDERIGTYLTDLGGMSSGRKDDIISRVTSAIREAEQQTKDYQTMLRGPIDEEELLARIDILDINFDELMQTVSFSVRLTNVNGNSVTAGMGV